MTRVGEVAAPVEKRTIEPIQPEGRDPSALVQVLALHRLKSGLIGEGERITEANKDKAARELVFNQKGYKKEQEWSAMARGGELVGTVLTLAAPLLVDPKNVSTFQTATTYGAKAAAEGGSQFLTAKAQNSSEKVQGARGEKDSASGQKRTLGELGQGEDRSASDLMRNLAEGCSIRS